MNSEDSSQVIQQSVRSIRWATLLQFLPRLVTPITTMILAAILVPDDFGVVAAATLVLTLASTIIAMGFGATIIQRKTMVDEAATMAFWMSLFLAGLVYIVLWLLSPIIASFYKIAALDNVLKVVGLSLIISAFTTIPTALLQRELKFKELFLIGVLPQIINGVISVILAILKFRYWSLVIGNLTGLLTGALLAWLYSHWKPKFAWHSEILRSIFIFSFWIMVSNFQSWFFLYADNALSGYFFHASGLGQYSLGFNIATLFAGMVVSPVAFVMYPAFCKLSESKVIGKEFIKVQSITASILFPICFGISGLAIPFIKILYANKWPELGFIIQILSIMPGIVYIWSLNADAYRSIGRPELWTYISFGGMAALFPLLIWGGSIGLREFVVARAIGSLAIPIICLFVSRKYLFMSIQEQFRSVLTPILSALIMYIVITILNSFLSPFSGILGIVKLGISSIIGLVTYIVIFRVINKSLFLQIFRMVRQAIPT